MGPSWDGTCSAGVQMEPEAQSSWHKGGPKARLWGSRQTRVCVWAGEDTGLCLGQLSKHFPGTWTLNHLLPSQQGPGRGEMLERHVIQALRLVL